LPGAPVGEEGRLVSHHATPAAWLRGSAGWAGPAVPA
jgi:hypothetical protein